MSRHHHGAHDPQQGNQGSHNQHGGQGDHQQQGNYSFHDHGKDSHHERLRRFRREQAQQPPVEDAHGPGRGHFDLAAAALAEMHAAGFQPEFAPGVAPQVTEIAQRLAKEESFAGVEDLRGLGWSSIDNDTSRDLDQIEVAERVEGGIRLRVAIGDVAAAVEMGSPIDEHAKAQTQTIYTAVKNFPMLPTELSTDMTSLNEAQDRLAVMMSFTVREDGTLADEVVSRARVRNRAQLAYSRVGPWLEKVAAGVVDDDVMALRSDSAREHAADESLVPHENVDPAHDDKTVMNGAPRLAAGWLVEQLKLQDEAAQALHKLRVELGALEFQKAEAEPVVADGKILDVHEMVQNRAMHLIEDLMVAANGVMARALRKGGRSGLQRVVVTPKRWDRIVELAKGHGYDLPAAPDSRALNEALADIRRKDPEHYPDVAVSTIKLLGPGEYLLMRPDDDPTGHFGLAARDYTHSTAPNRRFPDMVTQRVLHAMIEGKPAPYSDEELIAIANHCNEADKALRKIERDMQKRVAAVAMAGKVGQVFRAVITGASDKGVYARVISPPFEGRVVQGGNGLDVGDKVNVKLLHTDPWRAFIDFAFVGKR